MIHEVFMPALSSTMTEGKIVDWVKAPGDKVEKGETVVIVESDKADMDVESFYEGYLAIIVVPAGESAPVGEAIALIAETEAEIATAQQQAKAPAAAASAAIAAPAASPVAAPAEPLAAIANNGRTIVSPRARKLAKSLGVELASLLGSGPHGRIVAADVEAAAGVAVTHGAGQAAPATPGGGAIATAPTARATTPSAPATSAPTPAPTPVPVTPGQLTPFNTLQQAVIRSMDASLQVPVFRVAYTLTTDALDALYKQVKPKGVTMTALLAKAVGVTLAKHPLVNASYTPQGIQYNAAVNVAVAVAMGDGGLITPVLAQTDRTDLYSLSRNWQDLVTRARSKQLKPDEYSTGTFTLSNLGMFGVDRFDAILPPGQGAILAIGGSKPQMVVTADGRFGVQRQMTVNLTADHRIIYGADAAAFLKDLADLIENNPQSLTL
ncbi:MAG: 2-oxo acid dehydrogenase subunit E2 [Synechococcales cyanobacterium CRU_2_2]|nr:2-oxo acid dehydrogenase subunit E2 [Synechococcales cyanobacterium CRU_2_2]